MNAHLRAFLLDGEPLPGDLDHRALVDEALPVPERPDGLDQAVLDAVALHAAAEALPVPERPEGLDRAVLDAVAIDAAVRTLAVPERPADLDAFVLDAVALDAAARALPLPERPAGLDQAVLDAVAREPRGTHLPPAVADLPDERPAANRSPRWWPWLGGLTVAAAALMIAMVALPVDSGMGDPADWTPRGEEAIGPAVDLRIAVQGTDGGVDRLRRGTAYAPGEILLFRYDAHVAGTLHLVRIDDDGADVVHTQTVGASGTAEVSGDLQTPAGRVGYELEDGESTAVFALIRTPAPLDAATLARELSVGPDVEAVCAAARSLGGRCAAERVEAVR